jgi:hypothetical protein
MIPVDYQYTISAWIYRVIGKADAGFSAFLIIRDTLQGISGLNCFAIPLSLSENRNCGKKNLCLKFQPVRLL